MNINKNNYTSELIKKIENKNILEEEITKTITKNASKINFQYKNTKAHNILTTAIVYKRDIKTIKLIIKKSDHKNTKLNEEEKLHIFSCTIGFGTKEIIKLFINNKTDFNKQNIYKYSPLSFALICNQSLDVIKFLIDKTDFNIKYALHDYPLCVAFKKYRNFEIIKILIEKIDIYKKFYDIFFGAALMSNQNLDVVEFLLEKIEIDNKGKKFLREDHLICALEGKQNLDVIKFLFKKGDYKIKFFKSNPLCTALKNNNYNNVIMYLLKKNDIDINKKDKNGNTPLMVSLKYCYYPEDIKLFINEKTDLNFKDFFGYTPLMIALMFRYEFECIKLLINKKTDFNNINKDGNTALMIAFLFDNDLEVIKLLINNKTDFNKKNKDGESILQFALGYVFRDKIIDEIIEKSDLTQIDFRKNLLFDYIDFNVIKLLINKVKDINKKDFYGWDLLSYQFWKNRNRKIAYLLIFNH